MTAKNEDKNTKTTPPAAGNTTPPAAGNTTPPAAEKQKLAPAKILGVSANVPMPTVFNGRGSKSKYPFDALTEIGMSFGVVGRSAKQMASNVSTANRNALTVKRDANGATVYQTEKGKDANGAEIEVPTKNPVMIPTKLFKVQDVDPATDPEGANCRVWRVDPNTTK